MATYEDRVWEQIENNEKKLQQNFDRMRETAGFKLFKARCEQEKVSWKYWPEMIEPIRKHKLDMSRYSLTADSMGTGRVDVELDDFIHYIYVVVQMNVLGHILEEYRRWLDKKQKLIDM